MSSSRRRCCQVDSCNRRTCRCNGRRRWCWLSWCTQCGYRLAVLSRPGCTCPRCCCKSGIVRSRLPGNRRRPVSRCQRNTHSPPYTCFRCRSPSWLSRYLKEHSIGRWGRMSMYMNLHRCWHLRTRRSSTAMRPGWGRCHCHCNTKPAYVDPPSSSRRGRGSHCWASCMPSGWKYHNNLCTGPYRCKPLEIPEDFPN